MPNPDGCRERASRKSGGTRPGKESARWRLRLHEIVFEADTPAGRAEVSTQACPACSREGHEPDARFCKYCGGAH